MILEPHWIHVQWRAQVENVWVFPYLQIRKAEFGPEINVIVDVYCFSFSNKFKLT